MKSWSLHAPMRLVSVGLESTLVMEKNPSRFHAEVRNESEDPVWLGLNEKAEVGKGTRLFRGESLQLKDDVHVQGEVNAVKKGCPENIVVIEGV